MFEYTDRLRSNFWDLTMSRFWRTFKTSIPFRAVRKRDEPFGGIQLIICGDFLQLPPVCKANEETKFCFQVQNCS